MKATLRNAVKCCPYPLILYLIFKKVVQPVWFWWCCIIYWVWSFWKKHDLYVYILVRPVMFSNSCPTSIAAKGLHNLWKTPENLVLSAHGAAWSGPDVRSCPSMSRPMKLKKVHFETDVMKFINHGMGWVTHVNLWHGNSQKLFSVVNRERERERTRELVPKRRVECNKPWPNTTCSVQTLSSLIVTLGNGESLLYLTMIYHVYVRFDWNVLHTVPSCGRRVKAQTATNSARCPTATRKQSGARCGQISAVGQYVW